MKGVFVSKTGHIAVSSNPKDWKLPVYSNTGPYSAVEGNDVAGYVEKIGEGVTRFKVGDKVAAFTKMRTGDNKYGAYAEYTVSPAGTAFHLGPKTSFEDASALPLAYMTAALGLFKRLGLPTPDAPCTTSPPTPVLIWGASSAVGIYAVQFAKKAGLYVVGVAGVGCPLVTAHGADKVIDYRSRSFPELTALVVRAANGGGIHHALDAVSQPGTLSAIASALGKMGGGTLAGVLGPSPALPAGVEFVRTSVATAYGEDAAFATKWFDKVGEWMEEGNFRAQRVTVVRGGLEGVEEGLRRLQAGEVHSEKFVYRVGETPGLA